jgi:hypothetical protein
MNVFLDALVKINTANSFTKIGFKKTIPVNWLCAK